MKFINILSLVLVCVFSCSCASWKKPRPTQVEQPNIFNETVDLGNKLPPVLESAQGISGAIKNETIKLEEPIESVKLVMPVEGSIIYAGVERITSLVVDLDKAHNKLEELQTLLIQSNTAATTNLIGLDKKYRDEIDKLVESNKKQIEGLNQKHAEEIGIEKQKLIDMGNEYHSFKGWILKGLMGLSLLSIAAGIGIFFFLKDPVLASSFGGAGVVGFSVASAIKVFEVYLVIGGGALMVVLFLICVYKLFTSKKVAKAAVKVVQDTKNIGIEKAKERASNEMDLGTKKIIAGIKEEVKAESAKVEKNKNIK